ncbi:hypothetical protein ON010_g18383 [Phytophthora cinnamomi]|nr:hypothetical protein ON010_g18383 [Phytophthora cinnamomi]
MSVVGALIEIPTMLALVYLAFWFRKTLFIAKKVDGEAALVDEMEGQADQGAAGVYSKKTDLNLHRSDALFDEQHAAEKPGRRDSGDQFGDGFLLPQTLLALLADVRRERGHELRGVAVAERVDLEMVQRRPVRANMANDDVAVAPRDVGREEAAVRDHLLAHLVGASVDLHLMHALRLPGGQLALDRLSPVTHHLGHLGLVLAHLVGVQLTDRTRDLARVRVHAHVLPVEAEEGRELAVLRAERVADAARHVLLGGVLAVAPPPVAAAAAALGRVQPDDDRPGRVDRGRVLERDVALRQQLGDHEVDDGEQRHVLPLRRIAHRVPPVRELLARGRAHVAVLPDVGRGGVRSVNINISVLVLVPVALGEALARLPRGPPWRSARGPSAASGWRSAG